MSLFKNDSSIYDELDGKKNFSNFQRILSIALFVAIGFAVGNIYSTVNKEEVKANAPITTNSTSSTTTLSVADISDLTANSVVEITT